MRKSTVFISSVLTTFALVVLYGVVKAYQSNAVAQTAEVASQQSSITQPVVPTDVPAMTPAVITPEEAAELAAQVVGHDNLLSAETSSFNGATAYLITFTNKDLVYVGLDGQILSIQVAPVVLEVMQPVKAKNNNNNRHDSNQTKDDDDDDHDD